MDILPQFKKIKATLGRKVQVDSEINQGQQTKAPWGGRETEDPRPTVARAASTWGRRRPLLKARYSGPVGSDVTKGGELNATKGACPQT